MALLCAAAALLAVMVYETTVAELLKLKNF